MLFCFFSLTREHDLCICSKECTECVGKLVSFENAESEIEMITNEVINANIYGSENYELSINGKCLLNKKIYFSSNVYQKIQINVNNLDTEGKIDILSWSNVSPRIVKEDIPQDPTETTTLETESATTAAITESITTEIEISSEENITLESEEYTTFADSTTSISSEIESSSEFSSSFEDSESQYETSVTNETIDLSASVSELDSETTSEEIETSFTDVSSTSDSELASSETNLITFSEAESETAIDEVSSNTEEEASSGTLLADTYKFTVNQLILDNSVIDFENVIGLDFVVTINTFTSKSISDYSNLASIFTGYGKKFEIDLALIHFDSTSINLYENYVQISEINLLTNTDSVKEIHLIPYKSEMTINQISRSVKIIYIDLSDKQDATVTVTNSDDKQLYCIFLHNLPITFISSDADKQLPQLNIEPPTDVTFVPERYSNKICLYGPNDSTQCEDGYQRWKSSGDVSEMISENEHSSIHFQISQFANPTFNLLETANKDVTFEGVSDTSLSPITFEYFNLYSKNSTITLKNVKVSFTSSIKEIELDKIQILNSVISPIKEINCNSFVGDIQFFDYEMEIKSPNVYLKDTKGILQEVELDDDKIEFSGENSLELEVKSKSGQVTIETSSNEKVVLKSDSHTISQKLQITFTAATSHLYIDKSIGKLSEQYATMVTIQYGDSKLVIDTPLSDISINIPESSQNKPTYNTDLKEDDDDNTVLYVILTLIGIAAAVLCIIAIIMVVRKSKRNPNQFYQRRDAMEVALNDNDPFIEDSLSNL